MQSIENKRSDSRKRRQRGGTDWLEFVFVLLPLLGIITVIMDASWGIFIKATLQYAVRTGVRTGITITGTQATAANSNLTAMVKSTVQKNSLGLLNGTNSSYIQVHYLTQDATASGGVRDVSTCTTVSLPSCPTTGNAPGNIMEVEVVSYPLKALTPRFFSWRNGADLASTNINAMSADEVEPSGDVPALGTAP